MMAATFSGLVGSAVAGFVGRVAFLVPAPSLKKKAGGKKPERG